MSRTIKPLLIALGVLAAIAVGNVDAAPPDAHERARQLLQRPAVTAKSHPMFSVARLAPQDAHEQARRLLDRSDVIVDESGTPHEVAVALKTRDVVDAHVRASSLLARPLAIE